MTSPDAIVIGAGPNGLVAANVLADAGWDVLVLETQREPGGAVKTAEVTVPGFRHDLFSAFYPLAAASPALAGLELERHGLVWCRAPVTLAHVFEEGRAVTLAGDAVSTAASVERFGTGDGNAWLRLVDEWQSVSAPLIDALLLPFPPIAPAARLGARLRRPHRMLEFARSALLPVRRFTGERFTGQGAAILLAGNTLHTDLAPESALGGFYGWLLAMLGQTVGFPVPQGGAGELTNALVRRLRHAGGQVRCDTEVVSIDVQSGRATGVRLASGEQIVAKRAVLADVIATRLYRDLLGPKHVTAKVLDDVSRFDYDHGTVKVDWALRGPVPWLDPDACDAGTVHVGDGMDHLTRFAADLATGRVPTRPFILFGQMSKADPTRSPPGTETAWGYTHVPNTQARPDAARWDVDTTRRFVDCIEHEVERRAPGFRDLIIDRHVMTPPALEAANANLVGGAINSGTAQLHQQLVFRPTIGRAGPRTSIKALYLASASAHPGGGVHGAWGRTPLGQRCAGAVEHERPHCASFRVHHVPGGQARDDRQGDKAPHRPSALRVCLLAWRVRRCDLSRRRARWRTLSAIGNRMRRDCRGGIRFGPRSGAVDARRWVDRE